MPVASENLPKPTRIDLTMADTEELRTWTAGWCLRFCRPMQDGALHLDPWTLRAGPVHVAAFMSGQGAGTSRPAGVPKAVRVTLDANALRASKSPRMASQDGWITRFDDGPPLRILWHAECGELRCAVEVQPAFAANTWVGEEISVLLGLLRCVRPEIVVNTAGFCPLEPLSDRLRRALYDHACSWLFREVLRFRTQHPAPPLSEQGRRERDWLDLTLRRVIEEENRRGYLTPDTWRSQQVRLLEALHAPLGARVDLFPDAYQPVPPRPRG